MPQIRFPFVLAIFLLVVVVPALVDFYTDWLWFGQVGYQTVFWRSISARVVVGALAFVGVFGLLWGSIRVARGAVSSFQFPVVDPDGVRSVTVEMERLRRPIDIGIAVVSFLIALYASANWETCLLWLYAVPFGVADPILARDAGFYIFELPFLQFLQGLLQLTLLLATASVVALHLIGGNLGRGPGRQLIAGPDARLHLGILGALLLLTLAVGAWLRIPELLTTSSGILHGASYVDVNARMPALRLLILAAGVGALLALYQTRTERLRPAVIAVLLYFGVSVGGNVYSAIVQRFVVSPNQQVRETPYIIHNIEATRAAFALDEVIESPLSGEARLTPADLANNATTLDNVPLWNDRPLLDTFGQIQEIRTYYDFVSVDNDRYIIDGEYRQIMLSARELNSASLPERTWINERLTFTHGYGLTLGPVNQVTPEGLPVLFIKDLPPESAVDLSVSRPEIYYGELSNDHVFVNTETEEFNYPKGNDNEFGRYQGDGGVELGGLLNRLLFAIRFRSTDTLFAPNLNPDSRVMMYRRIADRVERIAPFLTYDPDPYLAISDGKLVWIQDAYTTSEHYPYSTSAGGGLNYIRNSIKVTIDAYHGETVFHLLDPDDPVAATVGRAFPGLLQPLDTMPEDLRNRLRYPPGIFALQAEVFTTFHMTNPAVFYNKEDQWEIPVIDEGPEARRMEPYYTIMKLPDESGPEYIQMLPYTPRQKDNLAAWLVARSDGHNYGQLKVFQFPKQTVVFGPRQIAARINQDQAIAPQITLWNQQGSEVIQGTLLVIPIEESLIYIRPLYLRSQGGRIPELKRVIVAYRNKIVMEGTLDEALERLFPDESVPGRELQAGEARPLAELAGAGAAGSAPLAERARGHFRRAIAAQRDGDWTRYGEEIGRLGEVLEQIAAPEE